MRIRIQHHKKFQNDGPCVVCMTWLCACSEPPTRPHRVRAPVYRGCPARTHWGDDLVSSLSASRCVRSKCHQQCALRCLYVPRMKHSPSNLTTSSPDAWPLPSDLPFCLPLPTTLMSPRPTHRCFSQPGSLASSARGCPAFFRVHDEVFAEVLVPRHLTGTIPAKINTVTNMKLIPKTDTQKKLQTLQILHIFTECRIMVG